MDIRQYLERINYTGELHPTLNVLTQLQQAHLMSVPFENLDIHLHVKIDLRNTFDKIVTRKRGGFCYELNGLFFELLKKTGFTVRMVSARAFDSNKGYGPEFDHMAIIVTIHNDTYLVDVGFGEFSFYPIKIELDTDQADPRGVFRIEAYDEEYKVVKKRNAANEYIPEYIFSEKERELQEFVAMCEYHQTSPESHFTQKRVCSLPTIDGRITLTGNMLKISTKGSVKEKKLKNEKETTQVLATYFKIIIRDT